MGIISAATPGNPFASIWPALLLAMTVAAAMAMGLFRRRAIVGPSRLDADEPIEGLTAAMLGGMLTWLAGGTAVQLMLGVHGSTATAPTAAPAPSDQTLDPHIILANLLIQLTIIAVILALILLFYRRPRRLGLSPGLIAPGMAKAVLGMAFVAPLMALSIVGTDQLWKSLHRQGPFVHEALRQLSDTHGPGLRVMLMISLVAVGPICEELFFRGCLQTLMASWLSQWMGALSPAWPRWLAVLLTSGLFASAHDWWSRPPIFVLAVCLGYAYERTGNLWTSIGIHAIFNAAEVGLFFQIGH